MHYIERGKMWFLSGGAYGCLRRLFHDVSCPADGPGRSLRGRHLSVQAFGAFSLIAYFGLCYR